MVLHNAKVIVFAALDVLCQLFSGLFLALENAVNLNYQAHGIGKDILQEMDIFQNQN